jgi:pimeloyl-ACP methyl ester carboxylesterase
MNNLRDTSNLNKKSTNVRSLSIQLGLIRAGFSILEQVAPGLAARWAAELFLKPRRHKRPLREQSILAEAESFSVNWKGQRLAAWSWGSGPVVLLVHGWEGRGAQLSSYIAPLAEAGYRVVAFDGPGHGSSEGNRSSIVDMADAINAVGQALGEVQAVVAHSMGAAATTLALKTGLHVERLVYIAPPVDLGEYARSFAHLLGVSSKIKEQMQNNIEARFKVKWSSLNGLAIAPTMDAELLVFHDIKDRDVPWKEGKALAQAWPGARLVTTSGLGHRKILHNDEIVAQAITFITNPSLLHRPAESNDLVGGIDVQQTSTTQLCATPGCNNPVTETWDWTGRYCSTCSVETELFNPQSRWGAQLIG